MNKYLEKIASATEKDRDYPYTGNKEFALSAAGASAAGVFNSKIVQKIGDKIERGILNLPPEESQQVMDKALNAVSKGTNTTITKEMATWNNVGLSRDTPTYWSKQDIRSEISATNRVRKLISGLDKVLGTKMGDSSVEDPEVFKNYLNTSNFHIEDPGYRRYKNRDVLFHEMGRARDLNSGPVRLKRLLSSSHTPKAFKGFTSAGIGGAMLANEDTRDYAWAAPIVGSLPTLREEYAASKQGLKLIKRHGGIGTKYTSSMAKMYGSHLLKPTILASTLAGVNHFLPRSEEKELENS